MGTSGATGPTGSTGAAGANAGALFTHQTDANNTGTGETDLYSDSIAGGQLAANGNQITAFYSGTYAGSATATSQVKVYFGGTSIFASGALAVVSASVWQANVSVIRVSTSVVRYSVTLNTPALSISDYQSVGELTGLDLTAAQVIKITAQSSGTGAGSNLITAKFGVIEFGQNATAGSIGPTGATGPTGPGNVATDTIWDAAGDLAVGTGADTAAKLASGAVGTVLTGAGVGSAPTWAAPAAGTILAVVSWGGGAVTLTAPTVLTAFDATNAAITFTAPASGNVLVDMDCGVHVTTGAKDGYVGLLEAAGQVGALRYFSFDATNFYAIHATFYVSGIGAGSHTYKLAGKINGGNLRLESATASPLILTVQSAP